MKDMLKRRANRDKGHRLHATGFKKACGLRLGDCGWQKGFTLIEVMIAIAIIAIALVVILHSYGLGVSMANESQDFSLATLLAQRKMAEIELEGFSEVGGEEGDFGEEYPGFTWRASVAETPIEDLRKMTLIISWDEKNLEVVTYLAKRE